jgi:ATP adenylyltransferase
MNIENPSGYIQITGCRFCFDQIKDRIVSEYGLVVAIKDNYPVSNGHILIISKNHSTNYFEMTTQEKQDADVLLSELRIRILKEDPSVTGFNVGMNCGESAGQTIFHTHIHLIPRRDGDTPNPKGGVRGVIPDKMGY